MIAVRTTYGGRRISLQLLCRNATLAYTCRASALHSPHTREYGSEAHSEHADGCKYGAILRVRDLVQYSADIALVWRSTAVGCWVRKASSFGRHDVKDVNERLPEN